MTFAAADESFYTTAGPFVTSDIGFRMFSDMDPPERVGGKRMKLFERAESLAYEYNVDLAVAMILKRKNDQPSHKIRNILNSSSVVHASLVEDLADIGAVDFKKASAVVKRLNTIEKISKPWILLNVE